MMDCVAFSFHQLKNSEAMLEAAKVTLEVKMVELEEEKEGKFIASYHFIYHYPAGLRPLLSAFPGTVSYNQLHRKMSATQINFLNKNVVFILKVE